MRFTRLQEKCRQWKPLLRKLAADKKKAAILLLCAAALALLALSEWTGKAQDEAPVAAADTQDYADALEAKLGALLSQIEGAGKTQVFVTLRGGTETVWARDEIVQDRRDADGVQTQDERTYVVLRSGSEEAGLPLKTVSPQVQGVAVVCEGADSPQVCRAITQTVTAALGVGNSHVSVVKMQSERK